MDYAASWRLRNCLLVNGFWRSGTTWLQQTLVQSLKAKSLFEPFSPAAGQRWDRLCPGASEASRHIYMPLSADSFARRDKIKLHLAMRGVGTHGYAHFLRDAAQKTDGRNLVVKFTRLGFLLDDMAEIYNTPIIHIRRNPAAVYASFKETDWSWRFEDVRFSEIYSPDNHEPGTPAHERATTLMRFDQSPVRRFAALWSLSEQAAQESVNANRARLVSYEDVLRRGASVLNRLQITSIKVAASEKASPVTSLGREKLSAKQRQNDWQRRLTREEIESIADISQELFPANGYFGKDVVSGRMLDSNVR
ncbi:MAG: sulfotransferase [Hyphomonas sp.]|uniref:sulfotransferase n=1 Tax=Hyphomonas sp. TaxID=87 RepID=UPI0035270D98